MYSIGKLMINKAPQVKCYMYRILRDREIYADA